MNPHMGGSIKSRLHTFCECTYSGTCAIRTLLGGYKFREVVERLSPFGGSKCIR